jgi:adenosine deaminase
MASNQALKSLSKEDMVFLARLPKAELHAHLNGSIPLECLREMAQTRKIDAKSEIIEQTLRSLENDFALAKITDFFTLFPTAIYALTSTPENVALATKAVLEDFLFPIDGKPPQCTYLELRTTPRSTESMTKMVYLQTVLQAMESFSEAQCNLIVSVDWRMTAEQALETVNLAVELFKAGKRVVGIDLCGDFQVSLSIRNHFSGTHSFLIDQNANPERTIPALKLAQEAGLPLTVHIAEVIYISLLKSINELR